MKIYSQLDEEEASWITIQGEEKYQEVLIGSCFGLGLSWGKSGSDVFYTILMEDDGYFFISERMTWSTYWLNPFQTFLKEAEGYLDKNFIRHDWGWKVK